MIRIMINNGKPTLHGEPMMDGFLGLLHAATQLLWVDVKDPSPEEYLQLSSEFGIHPLLLEDVQQAHERPKIEIHDELVFLVFYALALHSERPVANEVGIFAGKSFVLTIHTGNVPELDDVLGRWQKEEALMSAKGTGLLLYAILDQMVDGYFPVLDSISDRAEDLEDDIFRYPGSNTQEAIFGLKKDLLFLRRVVAPERDVLNVLVRRDAPIFTKREIVYFQDVYDHLLRITDAIDIYRDLLASALDASLSMSSYHLNVTVKRMTSSSIILMSMALISGIYGMNFVNMPELNWYWGYAFALGLMVVVGGSLALFFKRIDWL